MTRQQQDTMQDVTPDGQPAELGHWGDFPASPIVLDGPCVAVNGGTRLYLDPSDPTEPLIAVNGSGGILRGFAGLAEVEAAYPLTDAQCVAILNLAAMWTPKREAA